MEILLDRKNRKTPIKHFILLNEYCQVYCGLKGGYPSFSDNIDDARTLENDEQVRMIKQGTSFKLEKEFI
jgi:hypothetical protein